MPSLQLAGIAGVENAFDLKPTFMRRLLFFIEVDEPYLACILSCTLGRARYVREVSDLVRDELPFTVKLNWGVFKYDTYL